MIKTFLMAPSGNEMEQYLPHECLRNGTFINSSIQTNSNFIKRFTMRRVKAFEE